MAINLWTANGRPSSYSALPAGWGHFIPNLPRREYRFSFKAKSPTNKTIFVGTVEFKLTSELKEYSHEYSFTATNFHFYYDGLSGESDITIEDIVVIEKPLGIATINGLDGFGKIKDGMTGKLSASADFKGKVAGSVLENPHTSRHNSGVTFGGSTLFTPSGMPAEVGASYPNMYALDGTNVLISNNKNLYMAQHLFSFNVVTEVEKQIGVIPASDVSEKVQWIRNNFFKLTIDWYGYGSSVGGNKASIKMWNGSTEYFATTFTHTQGTISKLSIFTQIKNAIDNNGFVHGVVYAEPSDGVTASNIISDYVTLSIEMKQEVVVDSKWTFHPNITIIDDETLELNATGSYQSAYIDLQLKVGETYTTSHEDKGGKVYAKEYDASGTVINQPAGSSTSITITTKHNTKWIRVSLDNGGSGLLGKVILSKPMINIGSTPAPYEKKRGDRMVMPYPKGKNLIDLFPIFKQHYGSSYVETVKDGKDVVSVVTHSLIYNKEIPFTFKPNTQYTVSGEMFQQSNNNIVGLMLGFEYTDGTQTPFYPSTEKDKWYSFTHTSTAGKTVKKIYNTYGTGMAVTYFAKNSLQIEEGNTATRFETYQPHINKRISNANFDIPVVGTGNSFNWGLLMNFNERRTLKSAEVKAYGAGSVTFMLRTLASQTPIYQKTFNVVDGNNTLEFDWEITKGAYVIGTQETNHVSLARQDNLSASFFPKANNDGSVEVLGGISTTQAIIDPTTKNANWYFLFNMKFDGLNKTAKLYPRKNLVDLEKWKTSVGTVVIEEDTNEYIQLEAPGNATGLVFPLGNLKPNTQYTVQAMNEVLETIDDVVSLRIWNRTRMAYVSSTISGASVSMGEGAKFVTGSFTAWTSLVSPDDEIELWVTQTITSSADATFRYRVYKNYLQIEEGTTATAIEPYRLMSKPAKRNPSKIAFQKDWDSQPYHSNTAVINSIENGIMNVTSTTNDPYFIMSNLGTFDPNIYRYIEIRYRLPVGVTSGQQIFFFNSENPNANETHKVNSVNTIGTGQWDTLIIDMWSSTRWKDSMVTGWRYDWASINGLTIDLKYIRLVRDEKLGNQARR